MTCTTKPYSKRPWGRLKMCVHSHPHQRSSHVFWSEVAMMCGPTRVKLFMMAGRVSDIFHKDHLRNKEHENTRELSKG